MAIPMLGPVGLNPLPAFNPYPGLSPTPGGPVEQSPVSAFGERVQMMRQLEWLEPLLDLLSSMLNSPAAGPSLAPTPVAAASPAGSPRPGRIGPGNRVLVIGDSHTAGHYGDELDKQLRARGARVHTIGSSGASASNFINGRGTTVGYADHGMDGKTRKTASHATPKLEELIQQDKPDVIVVNLGANFRGASPAGIQSQVQSLGEVAKRHNIPIKWVGPPKPAPARLNMEAVQRFDQQMAAAVAPYGEYLSSLPYTPEYAGGDGLHYGGTRGKQLAQQWAQGIASNL
ncbi:MAG: hypothetical protein KF760_28585 [Candidatus Eremiobacteraeota bacterium]|nr:hypothetical protein [Candidatus Eremiobacteraeota bacterium]MCW5865853.1 hypothetical protein [Candidatus Eremiobacteraeota bacterium]